MSSAFETGHFAHVADLGGAVTLADVQRVVHEMHADLLAHPDEWENPTLDRYLDALAATFDACWQPAVTWGMGGRGLGG